MEKRKKTLTDKQLYERNLAEAINTRLILVASNVMNVCKFTKKQLDELDQIIKQELRKENMHHIQASDERMYTRIKQREKGVKECK